jgi:hypothetical protein
MTTLRIGLLLYVGSFFLVAVVGTEPASGYYCAYFSLIYPLSLLLTRTLVIAAGIAVPSIASAGSAQQNPALMEISNVA